MKRRWMAKFIAALFFTTVFCMLVWSSFIDGHLYSCSDGVMGYPLPADLASLTHDSWPLKTVPQIVRPTSINDPDLIKKGWTVGDLWALWAGFLGISLAVSAAIASLPGPPQRKT